MTTTMAKTMIAAALLAGTAAPAAAATTVIAFDDGTNGAVVDDFYAALGVTFAGASFTDNGGLSGTSGTLGLFSTVNDFQFGADTPIIGLFATTATAVSIRGIDVGMAGLRLEAYGATNLLIGFDQYFGTGVGDDMFRDLSVAGAGIASFRVFQPLSAQGRNDAGDGVLLDNLSFSTDTPAVPEPATWTLMLAGFALTAATLRYRRRPTRVAYG